MKYTGDSLLGVSFSVQTPKPLDCRTVVSTTQELYTIPVEIAYEGMSVSNLEDGYIYMLVDKTNITNSDGWVASYKALQLVSCTEAEYTEWKKNTTGQGTAIDSEKPYLHNDTYYYIYEDSIENKDTYYVNQEQYQRVWNLASSKADNTSFLALQKKVESNNTNITTNYLTKEDATNTYINKSFLEGTAETTLKEVTDKYQTAETSDSKYLKPSNFGVDDVNTQFSFLNTTAFEEYKSTVTEQLDTKITKNSRATLESLMVNTIQNTSGNTMSIKTDGIFYGTEKLAKVSEVPKWMCLSQEEYKQLETDGALQDDTYYLTYGKNADDSGFITADLLERQIKDLIGGAPEAYDTLKEIADKLKNNDDLYTAISNTIATKATTVALNEEITRAKAAEASITSDVNAKLSKKANSTALNDYVLTTALNEQVNTLNAAIDAKQPKGNYLTEHQSLEAYAKKSEIAEQIAAKADVTALTALEARIAALEAKHTETNTQIEA